MRGENCAQDASVERRIRGRNHFNALADQFPFSSDCLTFPEACACQTAAIGKKIAGDVHIHLLSTTARAEDSWRRRYCQCITVVCSLSSAGLGASNPPQAFAALQARAQSRLWRTRRIMAGYVAGRCAEFLLFRGQRLAFFVSLVE